MGEQTREKLREHIAHLEHVLPGQAPLRDFVHHNTLHGYQHLPFVDALRTARQSTGASGWLPAARSRALYASGRITAADLDAALRSHVAADMDESLVQIGPRSIHRIDVLRAQLVHGIAAPESAAAPPTDAATPWAALAQRVGREWTLRRLLMHLTGEDALEIVRPTLIRHLAAHLDQGLAAWSHPCRGEGFYAAWKASAAMDFGWNLDAIGDARREIGALPVDPYDAVALELFWIGLSEDDWPHYLERLALELPGWLGMVAWRDRRPGYGDGGGVPVALVDVMAARLTLERLVTQDIIHRHFGLPVAMPVLEKLAARLTAAPDELAVRDALAGGGLPQGGLPEALAGRAARLVQLAAQGRAPAAADWQRLAGEIDAWRRDELPQQMLQARTDALAALCRALEIAVADVADVANTAVLLDELARLDEDDQGMVWLLAYERHYREDIFAALTANHGRLPSPAGLPQAQVVFCMDDREEGMRRHLEDVAPAVETLGGAAHFGVFQNWRGVDDVRSTPLCPVVPVVVVPAHNVAELPRDTAAAFQRRRGRALLARWANHLFASTRRGVVSATLLTVLLAPFALLSLMARTLAPRRFAVFAGGLAARVAPPLDTRIELAAPNDSAPATAEQPRDGFTDAESAERLFAFLSSLGLTRAFAPLVVIMGHGSNSENNPHLAAYDCGACAGRHSGPNARLFAGMANRPGVRAELATRGIDIPAACWFLGAEHNTCDDGITWYDTTDIPPSHRAAFAQLDGQLATAATLHAQERCRRLASAPLGIAPAAALAHVQGRRHDFSQARPELGHATNACAFIGRRQMSRGAFFDRRSFLISYDPTQDAQGTLLERHLLTNGAVGAGISLEYYFSTANNDQYGCGTKIVHNVAGLLGAMEGANSDLRTGLPLQMIEIHEAMRLLVVVEQTVEIVTAIYQRQPPLQELVGNGWLVVAAKDPQSGAIHLFDPQRGWQRWQGDRALPTVKSWQAWFAGSREALPPALLEVSAT